MKRNLLTLFLSLELFGCVAQSITLEEARKNYYECTRDKQTCELLFSRLSESHSENNTVLNGYYGAVAANLANHTREPAQKIRLFNLGRRLLENAILSDSLNLELRFLRFSIQENCPPTLHYSSQITADKTFIIKNMGSASSRSLKKNMAGYLSTSRHLTGEEKEKVKQVLNKD